MKQVAVCKGPGRGSAESQQSADRTAVHTAEGYRDRKCRFIGHQISVLREY